jgi:hypothetical protein
MGGSEDDEFDRVIMLFAKLIARRRELLVRLTGDFSRLDHEQIERELKKIDSALNFLDAPWGDEG